MTKVKPVKEYRGINFAAHLAKQVSMIRSPLKSFSYSSSFLFSDLKVSSINETYYMFLRKVFFMKNLNSQNKSDDISELISPH